MNANDAISLTRHKGITLNALMPSDHMSDAQMNAVKIESHHDEVAKEFSVPNEITFNSGDLETVASTIQKTRKGVMIWFYFTEREWSREVPLLMDNLYSPSDARALRHSVVAIEPAIYRHGGGVHKGVWIEDSAHFGGINRRFITEDFYKKRNFWASYPINFKFEPQTTIKPRYDGSTKSLQDCLKHEGTFPSNVDSTGIFGPVTKKAVIDFQKKYNLNPPLGNVGPMTTAKLRELYP